MAKIDWARISGGTLKQGDRLLKELVAGKQAAYDALAAASVGKPLAAVLVPHLVPFANRPLALRLIAAIADALDTRGTERGTKRVVDALKALKLGDLLVDRDARVRAAAAVLAGALGENKRIAEALAVETDACAQVCQLTALADRKLAQAYVGDADTAVATAAATIVKDVDVLARAIGDASLENVPWPGRSLRAAAAHALVAAVFPRKLKGPPTAQQCRAIRALFASDGARQLLMRMAFELGLPTREETLRRIAGVRTPVPAGWVTGIEIAIAGHRDSALGHYLRYMQTGEGDACAIATAIAGALDAKQCARAILEICRSDDANRFEGELKPPALPKGARAAKRGDTWIEYQHASERAVSDAYIAALTRAGWRIVGYSYDPADETTTATVRLDAVRGGLELEGTFYAHGRGGARVLVQVSPELFTPYVEAALARHGKAFVAALAKLPRANLKPWGNVGYWVTRAALIVAHRTETVPDAAFDRLVIEHQGTANVLLANHMSYVARLPEARRRRVVAGILAYGHRSLAKLYPSEQARAAAAKGLARKLESYTTYDDALREQAARPWAFLGDHAVPVIARALAANTVGNPDLAAQILLQIGTPAAMKALARLARHPDKAVQRIAAAAASRETPRRRSSRRTVPSR